MFWTDFAKQHDKPVSLPEWGMWDLYADSSGGKDNPQFVEYMYDFITWRRTTWPTRTTST